jgi:hypothetical protein
MSPNENRAKRSLRFSIAFLALLVVTILMSLSFFNIHNFSYANMDISNNKTKHLSESTNENIVENKTSLNSPEPSTGKEQFNDVIIIAIVICVLLILLVLFRIFDNDHINSERDRLRRAGIPSHSDNSWFNENSSYTNNSLNQYSMNLTVNNPNFEIRTYTRLRCFNCNSPMESQDFCVHCGWTRQINHIGAYRGIYR